MTQCSEVRYWSSFVEASCGAERSKRSTKCPKTIRSHTKQNEFAFSCHFTFLVSCVSWFLYPRFH
jgi:hypothetical protein